MDELTIGDKIYISSKKAAALTGYAKDYIGQLCREGRVEATLVGRSWYVLETAIKEHRFGKEGKEEATDGENVVEKAGHVEFEAPKYQKEEVIQLPELDEEEVVHLRSEAPVYQNEENKDIVDMQSVWQEWFAKRTEDTTNRGEKEENLGNPRVSDEIEEPESSLGDIYLEEEDKQKETEIYSKQKVSLRPIVAAPHMDHVVNLRQNERLEEEGVEKEPQGRVIKERTIKRHKKTLSEGRATVVRALFIGLILIVLSVTLIGIGFTKELYKLGGPSSPIIQFLGGTRIISK